MAKIIVEVGQNVYETIVPTAVVQRVAPLLPESLSPSEVLYKLLRKFVREEEFRLFAQAAGDAHRANLVQKQADLENDPDLFDAQLEAEM